MMRTESESTIPDPAGVPRSGTGQARAGSDIASIPDCVAEGARAILTIDDDRKLNALTQAQHFELARRLDEVAARDDVYVAC